MGARFRFFEEEEEEEEEVVWRENGNLEHTSVCVKLNLVLIPYRQAPHDLQVNVEPMWSIVKFCSSILEVHVVKVPLCASY